MLDPGTWTIVSEQEVELKSPCIRRDKVARVAMHDKESGLSSPLLCNLQYVLRKDLQ